jgi:hypothetical protein
MYFDAKGKLCSILASWTSLAEPDLFAQTAAAYSSDREHSFHAMVNSAWRGQLETGVLRQVFTIRQGSAGAVPGCGVFSGFGFPCAGYERRAV